MPYIPQHLRDRIDQTNVPTNVGELNYMLTKLIDTYRVLNGDQYKTFNDIIGVLECCKLEMYRRKAAPYEDKKCEENGDVFYV